VTKRYAYRLWYSAKLRARAKNLEFTLSREFVEKGVLSGKCAVTKLKFSKKSSSKTHRSFAASIDRIDSKLGYTDSNCQIVCWIYNRAKGNGTHKEVLILAEALVPSSSKKQAQFMQAVAHNPKFAKKAGVPQSVGKDFAAADKDKTFKGGGKVADLKKLFKGKDTKAEELKEAKAIKSGKITPEQYAKGEDMEKGMKKGGKCMAKGGAAKEVMGPKTMSEDVEKGSNKLTKFGESAVQKRGSTKGKNLGDANKTIGIEGFKPKKYAKGGVTRADGIAQKGKTRGRYC